MYRPEYIHRSTKPEREFVNSANLIVIPRSPLAPATCSQMVDVCLLNARSINNKSSAIKDFVVDSNIDILALTETWLRADAIDQRIINDICPAGYLFQHVSRDTRGGGVAILYKQCFKFKAKSSTSRIYKSLEVADYSVNYSSRVLRFVVVYRPPPSARNGLTVNLFLEEFSRFLELLVTTPGPLVILGDMNFHVDTPNHAAASRFLDLLETFDLQQHINVATHRNGHTRSDNY